MKNVLFISIGIVLLMVSVAHSDTKYNPMSGEWELTTPGAELEYNPWNAQWHYVPKGVSDGYRQVVDTCISDCTGSVVDIGKSKAVRNKGRSAGSGGK